MTEGEVRAWLAEHFDVSRETLASLDLFSELLLDEARRQNLIAHSTIGNFWDRHIRDSAQLLTLAPAEVRSAAWLDLGSGPGLPGIVLALIGDMKMTLVESRTRRAAFLAEAVGALGLSDRVSIEAKRIERVATAPFDVIVARAFAPLPKLLGLANRFAHADTWWLLPKGKTVDEELEAIAGSWQGQFKTVKSATSPDASILVARGIGPGRRQ